MALSNRQLARAAGVLILGFVTSGVLGLVRAAVIGATYGTGDALDAFLAAQRIPETLFTLVAGGALGSSFLPVFARLRAGDEAQAWRLASAALTLVALTGIALAIVGALLAPWLVPALLVPEKAPAVQALTVALTQVMLGTVALFGVSGLCMALLNAHQSFLLPALAPALYNVGLIAGALLLARLSPAPDGTPNIYGLAWGAVLGAALHLGVQLPGIARLRAPLRVLADARVPGVGDVLRLMGPRVLAQGVVQINFAVNTYFATSMVVGSLSALNYAFTLMFFALGVIGQSIGSAVFPSLSALAAQQDMDGYKERLAAALRGVLFLSFPAMVGLILVGEPLTRVLFERAAWTAESSAATAWALAFYALGIPGFALLEVLTRAFYALEDTRTPVMVGIAAMLANIALNVVFIRFIGDPASLARGAFGGLALANAVTTLVEAGVLWALLRRRIGTGRDRYVLDGAARALGAALGMGIVVWGVTALASPAGALVTLIAGGAAGGGTYFALTLALRVEEARSVPALVLGRFRRRADG